MQLLLLRHADADTVAATDDARPLSDKGIEQARKAGQFCRRHKLEPELILSSPLIRARETAELFAREVEGAAVEVAPFLACGMTPEVAFSELRPYENLDRVMIVGHEPDFSMLAAQLLGLRSSDNLHVRKASLTLFEIGALRPGGARLEFTIPSRFT